MKKTKTAAPSPAKTRETQVYLTPQLSDWLESIAEVRGLSGTRGRIQPIIKEKLMLQMRAEQKP